MIGFEYDHLAQISCRSSDASQFSSLSASKSLTRRLYSFEEAVYHLFCRDTVSFGSIVDEDSMSHHRVGDVSDVFDADMRLAVEQRFDLRS